MNATIVRRVLVAAFVLFTVFTPFSATTDVAQAQISTAPGSGRAIVEYAWAFKMDFPNNTLQANWWLIERVVRTSGSLPRYDIKRTVRLDVSNMCTISGATAFSSERFVFDGANYIQCQLPNFVEQLAKHFGVEVSLSGQNADYWVAAQIDPDGVPSPDRQMLIDGALLGVLYQNDQISQNLDFMHTLRILTTDYTVPVSHYANTGEFKYVSGFGTSFLPTLNNTVDIWGGPLPLEILNVIKAAGDHGYMYWDSYGESHVNNSWTAPSYAQVAPPGYVLTFGCSEEGEQCFKGTAKSFLVDPGVRTH